MHLQSRVDSIWLVPMNPFRQLVGQVLRLQRHLTGHVQRDGVGPCSSMMARSRRAVSVMVVSTSAGSGCAPRVGRTRAEVSLPPAFSMSEVVEPLCTTARSLWDGSGAHGLVMVVHLRRR